MISRSVALLALAGAGYAATQGCKCTPGEACWPSVSEWNDLNTTVSGKLIHDLPPAISCYPGTYYNAQQCSYVNAQWSNSSFQSLSPVGYVYPTDETCPPVPAGQTPGSCILGPAPVYTINATEPAELAAGIAFAKSKNIRLVVRNTGHDLLGRSEGYGSLQIWIKYIQKGITYQPTYVPSDGCTKSGWTGAAFTIGGGYIWQDVYNEAFPRNLTVVGGGDPTVGCIGGYFQGGGHSPASRNYGLGADQVLEAQVVLADGSIVTANACQNSDLYFALRGGGGGTYGVVVSTVIKAYPSENVVAQVLEIAPLATDTNSLLDAIADVYAAFPALNDGGFSGYGTWSIASPFPLVGKATSGYVHTIAAFGQTLEASQKVSAPLLTKLQQYNGTSLSVTAIWMEFPSYGAYYNALSGGHQPVGDANSALTSRMFNGESLTGNPAALRNMITDIAGTPDQMTINSLELVGGGAVFSDASDPNSGVNPAWRSAYLVDVVARGWAPNADNQTIADVIYDITFNKDMAMRELTPFMGSYMNEANRFDPLWTVDFYGTNYLKLAQIKQKYDPTDVFYCPTCVSSFSWYSNNFEGQDYGPLCPTGF